MVSGLSREPFRVEVYPSNSGLIRYILIDCWFVVGCEIGVNSRKKGSPLLLLLPSLAASQKW